MATENHVKFEHIAEQVEGWREELGVPGATFGLHVTGETFAGGVGVTNVEHPLPVDDETIFQIGSITKTVTATAMMRLGRTGASWIYRRRSERICRTSGCETRRSPSVLRFGIC